MNIPFYQTYTSAESAQNVHQLVMHPQVLSSKFYTKACQEYFEKQYPAYKALLVNSCTRALELIAICLNLSQDDEVIMPSYNYAGTANSFAQRGAKIVFADLDATSMNVSLEAIQRCVSSRTRAVVVVNYAGQGYDLDRIRDYCKEKNLFFVEDNAQGFGAKYQNEQLGSFGDVSCMSFGSLKNISCGEGGVILYKPNLASDIHAVFNNGTNRESFEKGIVPNYEWVRLGSKFEFSEYSAAILLPLLQNSSRIIQERRGKWTQLYNELWKIEELRPALPSHMKCTEHNAHIFYLKFKNALQRNAIMTFLQMRGVSCSFHYTPLHSSIMATSKGYVMPVDEFTSSESSKLLRLPIFNALSQAQIRKIGAVLLEAVSLVDES